MGTRLSLADTLIAAHALASARILVTADQAFARVPQLKLADWRV